MQLKILSILTLFFSSIAYGQSTVYLRADSVKIMRQGGNANLQILNATRDSANGVLLNIGNGITIFQRVRAISASQFTVGTDTITISGAGSSLTAASGVRLNGSVITLSNATTGNVLTDDVYWDGHTSSRSFDILSAQTRFDAKDKVLFQSNTVDTGYTEIKTKLKIYSEVYSDANATILKNYSGVTLPTITANRIATFHNAAADKRGAILYVNNKNNSAFTWSVAGATLMDADGTAITTLTNRTFYQFMWDGSAWVKMNSSGGAFALLRNPTIAGYAGLDFSSFIDTVYEKRILPGFGWYMDTTALTMTGKVDTNNITSRLDRMKLRDSLLAIVQANNGLTETANVIQLGGALIQNTTITSGSFAFNHAGNGLGVTQTETSGIQFTNTTAAAAGAQQISPAIYFSGYGWKTTATAASQQVEIRQYLQPVQGTTTPTVNMLWESSINGATWTQLLEVSSTGLQHIGVGSGGGISLSSAAPVAGRLTTVSGLTITNSSGAGVQPYQFTNATGFQQTSGHTSMLYVVNGGISTGFYPTSGTADHDVFELNGYINQTGSATGISRGLHLSIDYIAGPDYRAIQIDEGAIWLNNTITAIGTTGNVTINKASGTANIAAAGTAVTVTNSWVTATSIVYCVVRTNDATAYIKNVVPAAGSFTVTLGAAATGVVSIGFVVFNPGTTTL